MSGPLHSCRMRVFIPVMLALLALLVVACLAVLGQKNRCVRDKLEQRLDSVARLFRLGLDQEAELIHALTDSVAGDTAVRQAWLAGDRERLFQAASAPFEEARSEYQVTHLYFHDPERVCFLRVHSPANHGDTIGRHTLASAVSGGKTSHGLELGPFGTLTLRVVRPWTIDGRVVGYIEMGKGIGHVAPELRQILDAELFFTVRKSHLDRADWQEGLKITGATGQWDLADDFVFIDRTVEDVPREIIDHVNGDHAEHHGRHFTVSMGDRTYRCGVIQLLDAGGRELGDIFALIDVTEGARALARLLAILIGFALAIAGLLGWLFWRYLGWIQGQLTQAQEDLAVCVERERHFTDDVAHELRNPLAGMRSTIDVALRTDHKTDELKESLGDCSLILEKMESRVDKLLMLARLDGKRVVLNKEAIELAGLVDDCWRPLREEAALRDVVFENRVPAGLTCVSDRGCLAIVFSNLLENGVQYAGVSERIWVTAEEDPEGDVRVTVANTGCQLDAAEVPLAFDKFWRGNGAPDCRGRHVGLGLPLVRRLTAALGGEASGEVSEGGVFRVCFVLNGSSAP